MVSIFKKKVKPADEDKGMLHIRLPSYLKKKVLQLRKKEGRTINGTIRMIVEQYFNGEAL